MANAWDFIRGILNPLSFIPGLGAGNMYGENKFTNRTSTRNNTLSRILNLGQYWESDAASDKELGKWFKDNYSNQFNNDEYAKVYSYLNSMNDADLGALLQGFYNTSTDWLGNENTTLDLEGVLDELRTLKNVQDVPKVSDYLGNYKQEATDAINAENADILKMYDDNLARQTDLYNQELKGINDYYNNYANKVLANDYNKNSAILNTYQSDMSRARQNALEAGANAGLRIAGNINTLLSAQNKQAATSLETSNQLAQAMLNQRNAASSVRGQYGNMMSQDTQNRANLKAGTFERIKSAQSNLYDERMNDYNVANQIATENNGNYVNSAFYDTYTKQK